MQSYLQPQHDGLPMRESGAWVAVKLDYLERYIHVFETSMHDKPWRRRNYIDLFAGPGKCLTLDGNVHLGSPLLALTTTHPFTHYFFVDLDRGNIAALQQRCQAYAGHDSIEFFEGDANAVVHEIVKDIQAADNTFMPGKWSSLNLAFLDPDGLELNWETVAALAELYRMDLIVHHPQMGLTRYMPKASKEEKQTVVDQFFGGRDWRGIYAKYQRGEMSFIHRELMNHYKERLQDLGYSHVRRDDETGHEPLIRNAEKSTPLYRLLFASKHSRGHEFWQAVTRRNAHGQRRLPLL